MWRWSTLGWKDGYLEGRWEKRLNTMTGGSMLWMKSLSGAGRCQNEGMGAGCHYNEVRITLQSFQTLRIPRHLFSQGTCPTAAVFHEHAARNFVEAPQTIPSQSLETAEGRKLAGSWLPVSSGIIRYGIRPSSKSLEPSTRTARCTFVCNKWPLLPLFASLSTREQSLRFRPRLSANYFMPSTTPSCV
jgi:hypothetical protein